MRGVTATRSPRTAARQQPPLATTREKYAQQQRPSTVKEKTNKKYYRCGGLTGKHLFLIDLEAAKFKIKVPANLVSGDDLLPPSHFALTWRTGKGALWGAPLEGTKPICESLTLMT